MLMAVRADDLKYHIESDDFKNGKAKTRKKETIKE